MGYSYWTVVERARKRERARTRIRTRKRARLPLPAPRLDQETSIKSKPPSPITDSITLHKPESVSRAVELLIREARVVHVRIRLSPLGSRYRSV